MSEWADRSGEDPRRAPPGPEDNLAADDLDARPAVARRREGLPLWLGFSVLALLAVVLFLWLSAGRRKAQEGDILAAVDRAPPAAVAAAPPVPLPAPTSTSAAGPLVPLPAPQFTTSNAVAPPPPPAPAMKPQSVFVAGALGPAAGAVSLEQRRRAPALVVDLGGGEASALPANPALAPARPGALANPALTGAAADAAAAARGISEEERFAERVGSADAERSRAVQLRNLGLLVAEGATVPATLETALDSDLPGFARAVVSRDIKSFDGRNVLIPRGSRVIGQYKAATALGASRVFVIWTRLIRPDGASIQLGSPAADDLGRAGLGGKVDRHFFTRFGSAILLSVINAGAGALSNLQTNAQVYIGSSADATNVAAAALQKDGSRPPTIRTPQGAAVNVFVARDLDFSAVGPFSAGSAR